MRPITAVALFAVAVVTPARAESEGRALTLDEAIQVGRLKNRDLKATREHLRQARTDVDRAWAPLLPTVSIQGKYTLNNREVAISFAPGPLQALGTQVQADTIKDLYLQTGKGGPSPSVAAEIAQLAQFCHNNPDSSECNSNPIVIQKQHQLDFIANALVPLVVPYAYHGLRAARETYEAQEKNADALEAQLLLSVAVSFFAAAGDDEVVVARRHGIEVARQTLDNAKARLDAGVANRVDITRAEQAVVRAEQSLREAEDAQAAAYRTLATVIQLRERFRVVAAEEPTALDTADDALVAEGLKLRPELLVLERELAAADDSVLSAKLRWAPTLSGFGFFRAFNSAGFSGDHYAFAVGLQLDWLLYDGGLRLAQQRQTESIGVETELRRAQLRDTIGDEIVTARRNLETKRAAVSSARRELALAGETLALTRVQRDAGTATQLDLLLAQDAMINAEVNVARARFELGLTNLQLRRATGEFPGRSALPSL